MIEIFKRFELPGGGIRCWVGDERAYPEITGYCIPTLLKYGELDFADRCGEYLMSIQNDDGSFNGLHDRPAVFDTAACYEGLRALNLYAWPFARKAREWITEQRLPSGLYAIAPGQDSHLYNHRVSGLMGEPVPFPTWEQCRLHYIAYAIEGLYLMAQDDDLERILDACRPLIYENGLMPYIVSKDYKNPAGYCATATAQFGWLYALLGDVPTARRLYAGLQPLVTDSGVYHDPGSSMRASWTLKYYLDLEHELFN